MLNLDLEVLKDVVVLVTTHFTWEYIINTRILCPKYCQMEIKKKKGGVSISSETTVMYLCVSSPD